ncbi:MAG: DUF697 domain-containing protein, partial [Clostridiales bacterium]|nr:DUF697 domain-containing protein [Clostridiales bacterium]
GPEETKEVAQAQVNFKETLNTIKSAAKTTMTKPQQIACHSIIHGAALVTAACAFIPVPVADSIPITTAQISMVIGLGKVFNNEITKSDAKVLLATVAAPLAGRAAAKVGLMLIPGVGWALNGAIAATITEILGWTVAMDFAKKGRG